MSPNVMIFYRGKRILPKTLDKRFQFWYYIHMTTTREFKDAADVTIRSQTWQKTYDREGMGQDGNCDRCGKAIESAKYWIHRTTHGFAIPADLAANYPDEGTEVTAEFSEYVAKYGMGQGCFPIGNECAKRPEMKGYVFEQ